MLPHSYEYGHTVDATCTTEGAKVFACVCGLQQSETIPTLPHHYELDHIVEATCTTKGAKVFTCVCGLQQTETLPMLPHSYEYGHTVEATCTSEGKKIFTCICGLQQTETIPTLPHHYELDQIVEATCTTEGAKVFSCVCGLQQAETIPMLPHSYEYDHTVEATCTSKGKKVFTCVCGLQQTEAIPMLPHSYSYSHTIHATCTATGKVVYACICGKQQYTTVEKLPHSYILIDSAPATQTAEGYRIYACSACHHSYTETIAKLPPAYMTEYCGSSLLGKALPHTTYFQHMMPIMARYAAKMTREASLAAGLLDLPSYQCRNDFISEYRTVYRYLYYALPYSIFGDAGTNTAQFLAWATAEQYAILEACYAEVYRILGELGIDESTSKYDAIYRINDYLCEMRYYQTSAGQDLSDYYHNTTYYSMFSAGTSCYNYAIAFQMLCLGAGIECHYYPSKTMNHAWNLVYFDDDTFYWVDVCWNDTKYQLPNGTVVETSVSNGVPLASVKRLRESYLLITTEQLLIDHKL